MFWDAFNVVLGIVVAVVAIIATILFAIVVYVFYTLARDYIAHAREKRKSRDSA